MQRKPARHSRGFRPTRTAALRVQRVAFSLALLTVAPLATAGTLALLPARLGAMRALRLGVDCCVSFIVIWASVPLCMAIFPQRQTAATVELEPWLANARHPRSGAPVREVWFNKGL